RRPKPIQRQRTAVRSCPTKGWLAAVGRIHHHSDPVRGRWHRRPRCGDPRCHGTVPGNEGTPAKASGAHSPRRGAVERGLINAQPQAYGRELDEREVVCRKLVVTSSYPPTLLDLVEEPLDHVAAAVQMRTEAQCLFSVPSRWYVRPGPTVANKCSDPVRIISAIGQEHLLPSRATGVWSQVGCRGPRPM